jgi:hypothetical protein
MVQRNATLIGASGRPLRKYPFVPWARLKPAINWKQGQHALSVGGTGSGKSTVAGEFLPRRQLVVVCVSKGMDDIFEGPYYRDYETIRKWPPPRSNLERVLLRPANAASIVETRKLKAAVFRAMFDHILLRRGYWCIDVDEEHYMCESLGMEREVTDILEQGRSAFISMWNNTQRPAGIPLATYVNSALGFFFSSQEEYDVRRLGRMRNKHTNAMEMARNIEELDSFNSHEFVFLDRSGKIPPVRSIVDIRRG